MSLYVYSASSSPLHLVSDYSFFFVCSRIDMRRIISSIHKRTWQTSPLFLCLPLPLLRWWRYNAHCIANKRWIWVCSSSFLRDSHTLKHSSSATMFTICFFTSFSFFLLLLLFEQCQLTAGQLPKLDDFMPKKSQNLGSKFTQICSLQEGAKPVRFEWYRNDKLISSSDAHHHIETSVDNSILVIDKLSANDSGFKISCSASNAAGRDTRSTVIIVRG